MHQYMLARYNNDQIVVSIVHVHPTFRLIQLSLSLSLVLMRKLRSSSMLSLLTSLPPKTWNTKVINNPVGNKWWYWKQYTYRFFCVARSLQYSTPASLHPRIPRLFNMTSANLSIIFTCKRYNMLWIDIKAKLGQ